MTTYSAIYFILMLLTWATANNDFVVREYVWHTYEEFRAHGWNVSDEGATRTFLKPSEVDPTLFELNEEFTDEVWGLVPSLAGQNNLDYALDLGTKPEHCGIHNATVSLKFYLQGNPGGLNGCHIYPACSSFYDYPNRCGLFNSQFSSWNTTTYNVALSASKKLLIRIRLTSSGLFLMDEVRLSYALKRDMECPGHCDHNCDFRGIDCSNYYTCINKQYMDFHRCDNKLGLAFNPNTKSCDRAENVEGCHGSKPSPPSKCISEFRPHQHDCSLYYFCRDSCHLDECELRQCPNGLLWSMDAKGDGSGQQQCDLPVKAVCFNGTMVTTYSNLTQFNALPTNLIQFTNSRQSKISRRRTDEVIFREYVWHNFTDFISYGWTEGIIPTTNTYNTPSELNPRLYELNENFTDSVWGWRQLEANRTSLNYIIDLGIKPEHCGIINATIYLKYYLHDNMASTDSSYIFPACTSSSYYPNRCRLTNSTFGVWSTETHELVLSKSKKVEIAMMLNPTGGLILFDEVRLSFAARPGLNCPYSCNHDSDYRGIDCSHYYTCIDSRYKEFRSCNNSEGLAFNPLTKSCDLMENVLGCQKPDPKPQNCTCEFKPHKEDCSRYYFCPNSCHVDECDERKCPGELFWSVDANLDGSGKQQCVPSSMAVCYDESSEKSLPTENLK